MNISEKITKFRDELEELNPTQEEVEEYGKDSHNCNFDSFITDNTWRDRKIGETYHIHIGFSTDLYLNVKEATEFTKWLKSKRSREN